MKRVYWLVAYAKSAFFLRLFKSVGEILKISGEQAVPFSKWKNAGWLIITVLNF